MTDRELLALAAKAAGIELRPIEAKNVTKQGDDRFIGYITEADQWPRGWFNPLTDDGDALRLAVKLGLVVHCPDDDDPCAVVKNYEKVRVIEMCDTLDHDAATRRAIVRAAAEIGKEKAA